MLASDPTETRLQSAGVPQPKIEANGVSVVFPVRIGRVHALGPVTLSIGEGEFLCIVGPSGCGKSTFLRAVGGLVDPTEGELRIQVSGHSLLPIATVFQDFNIFPWKTVEDNVAFGLVSNGVSKRDAISRAHEWLHRLGLRDFAKAYPDTLSGGMKQRVSIARALAVEPEVLLMDEPFASLDAQLREILQEELLQICQAERRTVLFVTHSLDEALVLGDRVMIMSARPGRVVEEIVVPFERPRTPQLRESAEFAELRAHMWGRLKSEVESQLEGSS